MGHSGQQQVCLYLRNLSRFGFFFFFFKGETLGHEFISLGYMRFAHHKERRDKVKRACAVVAGFFQSAELSGRAANGTGR